jgi:hypothetical protein
VLAGAAAGPDAPVTEAEVDRFAAEHAFWAADWVAYAGDGALADPGHFERDGARSAPTRPSAVCG